MHLLKCSAGCLYYRDFPALNQAPGRGIFGTFPHPRAVRLSPALTVLLLTAMSHPNLFFSPRGKAHFAPVGGGAISVRGITTLAQTMLPARPGHALPQPGHTAISPHPGSSVCTAPSADPRRSSERANPRMGAGKHTPWRNPVATPQPLNRSPLAPRTNLRSARLHSLRRHPPCSPQPAPWQPQAYLGLA